ncbi:unnamed protein product [Rotaria sordida]|nr:unnamed protein product [Rotaria sordida]CAF1677380.1 unnamed protein product [Rotaria sordida]
MNNLLVGNIQIKRINLRNLPTIVQVWSYLMVFVPILCIPGYAIYKLIVTPGKDFDERLQRSVQPEESIHENIYFEFNGEQQVEDKIEIL